MAELTGSKQFSIDSTMELVADFYEATVADPTVFITADPTDTVTLRMGLKDAETGVETTVGHIDGATIDEHELTVLPNTMLVTLRGRDQSAKLMDRSFTKHYRRSTTVPNTAGDAEVPPSTPEVLPADTVVGEFKASEIAKEIVEAVGLTLSWEVRDYTMQVDFDADGRSIDILRTLIQPWSMVEPFKADIFIQGNVVIVRHRQLPDQLLTADTSNTFTIKKLRRSRTVIRKRFLKQRFGTVTLKGRRESEFLEETVGPKGGISSSRHNSIQVVNNVSETFANDGTLLSRVETEITTLLPLKLKLQENKKTYAIQPVTTGFSINPETGVVIENQTVALALVLREVTNYFFTEFGAGGANPQDSLDVFEASMERFTGPVLNPLPRRDVTLREIKDTDPLSPTFGNWLSEIDDVGRAYDGAGFLLQETTRKTKDGVLVELIVRTLSDLAAAMVQQVMERYTGGVLTQRDVQTQGGYRPGGSGRSVFTARTPGLGQGQEFVSWAQIEVVETISTDPNAQDFTYSNLNLTTDDLNFLMSLFRAADNLFEYEVYMEGVGIPWLRRGIAIKITTFFTDDGVTEISLPVLLVTEVRSSYDESNPRAQMSMDIRAFGWRST